MVGDEIRKNPPPPQLSLNSLLHVPRAHAPQWWVEVPRCCAAKRCGLDQPAIIVKSRQSLCCHANDPFCALAHWKRVGFVEVSGLLLTTLSRHNPYAGGFILVASLSIPAASSSRASTTRMGCLGTA